MLSFANAPGNFFNVLGKLGKLLSNARSNQNTQLTALTNTTTGVVAQLNNESDIQAVIGSSYVGILNGIADPFGGVATNVAQQYLNRLVYRDNPRLGQTLQQQQTILSIQELIRQMKLAGASVLAMTVTATPGLFTTMPTNVGNGIITASTKRPFDGLTLENSLTENLLLTCINDSYNGRATAGNEPLSLVGCGAEQDPFAFDWPLGSNASIGLSAIDGNADNSQGNGLTNSGFETWTTNTPDNFTIETGTAGVQVFQENSVVYDGTAALRILGDGTTLTTLSQTFNSSSGTTGQLSTQTQYSVNLFLRRDGTAPGAGTLVVELTDSTGQVIKDAAGVNNTFSVNLTTLNTIYTSFTGIFRTPAILPSDQKIRLRLSTALTSGRSVYCDKMSMGIARQAYVSGPYVAVHSGSIPFQRGDYATIAISNSRGTAGTLDTMQTIISRFLPQMISNEFLLPSSSSPTISDSAIVV